MYISIPVLAANCIQFQLGMSLPQFMELIATEEK
jgi:hypothetical protein